MTPQAQAQAPLQAVPEALRPAFEALAAQYPGELRPSLVLPLLHAVQAAKGWVDEDDAGIVATYAGVPKMQVVEAMRWYSMFNQEPKGRHVIKVCRNIVCSLRGSEKVVEHLRSRLGIDVGQTTPDGRYTLELVECMASCGTAPAMQVDETYHENLDAAKVDRILQELAK